MPKEFLELIERVRADDASVQRMFGDAGVGVRRLAETRRGHNPAQYAERLQEAVTFIAEVMEGRRPFHHFKEAMTTSDFPLYFADTIDRMMLGAYREVQPTYQNYVKISDVRDFRTVKRFAIDGAETVLGAVNEQGEYPMAGLSEAEYSYAVSKYGRVVRLAWETMVNDDLDAFRSIPERLGRAARRSEEDFATRLFADANGPHASLYTVGNGNIVTGNPVLSIAALQTAMTVLSAQTDADGEPIFIDAVELVVPPALEITALNILNALELRPATSGGATAAQTLVTTNWMKGRVRLNVNYYLPIVSSTADGDTAWYLFANPNSGRPALEMGFLRGHREPELFVKEPNARRVGGGPVDPTDGDFENDSITYKVRHVFGGTRIDPKMTVASEGDGT